MDTPQFVEFMKMQQQMMAQLAKIAAGSSTTAATTSNSNIVQKFDNFDATKESYRNYIQRFKNYVELNKIDDNKDYCAKLLLNSIGADNFSVVTALAAPKATTELQYDELLELLEKHLAPKINVLVAQHKFLSKNQSEGQSVAKFVAALRADIIDCEFVCPCKCKASIADVFLRAQFIRGINDSGIREQLLMSSTLTFDDIVAKALVLEAAKVDARELAHTSTNAQNGDINKIYPNKQSSRSAYRQKPNVNYDELGISGLCMRCGRNNHFAKDCKTNRNKLKCASCNKTGHVAKVCISTLLADGPNAGPRVNPETNRLHTNQVQDGNDEYGIYRIIDVYQNDYSQSSSERYFANIFIEGKPVKFEVDSGSGYSFLPLGQFKALQLEKPLTSTNIVFRSYTQNTFIPEGKVKVNVKFNNRAISEYIYVVPDGCSALIGRTWIRNLGINLKELDDLNCNVLTTSSINCPNEMGQLMSEFKNVFDQRIGCVPNYKVSLQLRENATPVYTKERQIPYALTDRVNAELESLEKACIITKIANSDWGSPLVVIPKADGGIRLCVDYKVGVNQRLVDAHYPIRKLDQIFNSLRNSKYFCRLDLYKAYLHIQVDEASSEIQTISTHKGTFRMNRLSFGIKTAPSEFNRIIDQILRDVPKAESYFDDIVVHGATIDECKANLRACLRQLQQYDLHLNLSKCKFFEKEIEFLGHSIQFNKIQKLSSKIKAITEMPTPESAEDVRRFLGMVTYYARFIPNASTVTAPLRRLLQKNSTFKWTKECENAFNVLKKEIVSDRVLMPYNPELPVQLACDASPTGIAGVLSHIVNDEERPIAFASRSLTNAEQNYSQLDREALAIVYAIQHYHEYLYGRLFKLITDNQPLSRIFHQNAKLPQMTSSRLQRYAAFLTGYNYVVATKKSEDNVNADCLSRAPSSSGVNLKNRIDTEVHFICYSTINQINSSNLNFDAILEETEKDADLSKILKDMRNNSTMESDYTIDSGILFKGQRVVIPASLQKFVLEELHHTHIGITKMKQLARRYVYWVSIDRHIENFVRSCAACAVVKKNPPKVTLHPWEEPEENWQRIHIDYAGPYQGYYFLVVVDAKSKWAEVGMCSSAPTSSSTKEMLQNIFARNGYPDVMVSDNATIFKSDEFSSFCDNAGIFQKFIAPGHPATNGLAERNVQTLKQRLASMSSDTSAISIKLREILFKYRATPLQNGKTPSEQYLGRQIRTKLDTLKPKHLEKSTAPEISVRQLSEGDRVQSRCYTSNKSSWKYGVVVKKLGRLHYIVKLDEGMLIKRHLDQLRSTDVKSQNTQAGISDQGHERDQQLSYTPDVSTNLPPTDMPSSNSSAATPEGFGMSTETQDPSAPNELSETSIQQPVRPSKRLREIEATPHQQPIRSSKRQRNPPKYFQDYIEH